MKKLLFLTLMALLVPVLAFGAADVTFEWDSNTEADISHYNIYRSDDGTATWNQVNASPITHSGSGTETWMDLGVSDGTYSWYVTAVDTEGNESQPSNIVSATIDSTAPQPPANFLIALIQKILAFLGKLFSGNFAVVG